MQQNENQLKPLMVKSDVHELSAQHLHHSTESLEEQKLRRNHLSDCAESTSSIESLSEDQQKQQQVKRFMYSTCEVKFDCLFSTQNYIVQHKYDL